MSDPQLRKDINKLQGQLRNAKARIVELESAPPKVVTKVVEKEVPGPVRTVVKEVIKEVPIVEIKRVEVPIVKYVKCPKQEQIIKELRARLK